MLPRAQVALDVSNRELRVTWFMRDGGGIADGTFLGAGLVETVQAVNSISTPSGVVAVAS